MQERRKGKSPRNIVFIFIVIEIEILDSGYYVSFGGLFNFSFCLYN